MTDTTDNRDQVQGVMTPGEHTAQGDDTMALVEYNVWTLQQYPGAVEQFKAMLEFVPEPDDDAAARIVMQIMGATGVEDLDKPWDVEGMRDYEGTAMVVHGITKMPSDYNTGLGVYLVCRVSQPGIGEEFVLTTGSVSIVAQLVKAYQLDAFPLEVVPRESEKPTRKGYRPMHLEMVRRGRRVRANVIEQNPAPANSEAHRTARQQRIRDEVRATPAATAPEATS